MVELLWTEDLRKIITSDRAFQPGPAEGFFLFKGKSRTAHGATANPAGEAL